MNENQRFPWAGVALAVLTAVGMLFAGAGFWLTLVVLVLWVASLWLLIPREEAFTPKPDAMQFTRTEMRDLIEHSGLPILMLDGSRIAIANSAAREVLGRHVIGQDVRVALRHPAAVELLGRSQGGSATIQGLTGPRSIWQMNRQPLDNRYSLVELANRTAEADISRAHTDFVANASHELRTPLASIIGYIETLVEEGDDVDPAMAAKFHTTVLREAKRLQSLVDDLMSLSRIEAEKHDQPSDKLSFAPVVEQAARDGAGPNRTERLILDMPEKPVVIRGERQQLEQLVRNMVDNGLKYGSPETEVTVTLREDERGMAVLSVVDRGEGIAPEHIPHLTRRFYRTDPGRSRAAGGTGLGLAIVKHIVERHRGRLDITSKLGQGTTVTVRIPAVAEPPETLS
ncbi:ATP-binding protein [Altericroceibacterium xinjiangense]|uniref:ATP-binding protein n=1 Tax=Altericroceibacterium xinjiangense TaxID=762261 RepID=UPI001F4A02F2|nr:ATP-binding protein [Altericroceibacterium xinjiangense]